MTLIATITNWPQWLNWLDYPLWLQILTAALLVLWVVCSILMAQAIDYDQPWYLKVLQVIFAPFIMLYLVILAIWFFIFGNSFRSLN